MARYGPASGLAKMFVTMPVTSAACLTNTG